MDITDVERYIKGSEEINRKREVIGTVISMVEKLIKETKGKKLRFGDIVVCVAIGSSVKFVVKGLGSAVPEGENIKVEFANTKWSEDGFPYPVVPMVYNHLPEIIEAAIEAFPNSGIAEHFHFFSEQAPDA